MEEYYQTIAEDVFRPREKREQHVTARRSLRLVSKHFNDIVTIIPKPPGRGWILEQDNGSRSYPSGEWERIDVRLDFMRPNRVFVTYTPATTFRLFVQRMAQPVDPLDLTVSHQVGLIEHPTDVISHPNSLKVLHLQLEYCFCTRPPRFTQCIERISHLTTLSLCLGTSNFRDMIYESLSLPILRVLFLKFPIFGTRETALQSWTFPSLDILSLDLRIARSGVLPVPSMPTCISSFITRHGSHLYGLRLQPGPWAAPRKNRYLLSMNNEAEKQLWDLLPELKVLSTDFTHFSLSAGNHRNKGDSPFRNVVTLNQIGKPISSTLLVKLAGAVDSCPTLQVVHIPSPPLPWMREAHISQCKPELLTALRRLCRRRNVSLYY